MKSLVIGMLFICMLQSVNLKAQEIASADAVLKEATAFAKIENKNVLVIFTASWCSWCHKMQDNINDSSVKAFFDANYVVRYLTVKETPEKKNLENRGADLLLIKYHGNKSGIPFWLVFDGDAKLLADSKSRKAGEGPAQGSNVGCPATPEEVNYFIEVLSKTSAIKPGEAEKIRTLFLKSNPS